MDRFTKKAAGALGEAMECAGRLGHTYIGSEHLLLGILRQTDSIGARMLLSRGITFEKAEKKVVFSVSLRHFCLVRMKRMSRLVLARNKVLMFHSL